jgi:DNA polymerase III subunit alpha
MAANLSLAMDDTDKVKILAEDAVECCGLELLPPDINLSNYHFMPVAVSEGKARQIRYGLGAVKGSGQSAIEAIVQARESGGPFTDLFDFARRVDRRQINRRTVESLVRAGAFDCFGEDRAVLLASVGLALECAEQAEASINQVSLFGDGGDGLDTRPEYVKSAAWSEKQRLMEEKAALGFYLSGHLFHAYAEEARRFARTRLADLVPAREPKTVAGIIAAMRTQMTQRGKMLILTLDDGSATMEVAVFSEVYEASRNLFKEDEFLAVQGKVSEDRFSGGLRISAEKVMDLASARVQFGRQLAFSVSGSPDPDQIKKLLAPYRSEAGLPLTLRYAGQGADCEIRLADDWRVMPVDALTQSLIERLGARQASVEY